MGRFSKVNFDEWIENLQINTWGVINLENLFI